MKLNKGHFLPGTGIIHFLGKTYQELNFKTHLNSLLFLKTKENAVRFAHSLFNFIDLYLFVFIFSMKLKVIN